MKSIFFIDGFNLYHAIDSIAQYRKYKWLNLKKLAENLIGEEETLEQVLYFTAYCTWDKQKRKRHKNYVEALTSHGVHTVQGKFAQVTKRFNKDIMPVTDMSPFVTDISIFPDEIEFTTYEEKRTDVNVATKIVDYAYQEKYDHAYVISADGDIAPAIETVRNRFPQKKFTAVLPIGLSGHYICKICDFNVIKLEEKHLIKAQLPNPVIIGTQKSIEKPHSWN